MTVTNVRLALMFVALAQPAFLAAQDSFPDVEYIAGKDGFAKKEKGTLTLTSTDIVFVDKKGHTIFEIPLASVTEVSNDTQVRDASVGSKMLWGDFAGSRKQEFVRITSESDSTAEGIEFKVKQGTSANVVAKIRFSVKKATGAPLKSPADSTTGTPSQ